MKKQSTIALALVVLTLLFAACTEQSITKKRDAQGGSTKTAEVGDAITLAGNDDALQMKVTVLEVVDPAKKAQFSSAGKNERLVAVKIELENVGDAVYSDAPSNGATIIDAESQGYDAFFADEVEPALGTPKIAPGDKRVGFLTFIIPKSVEISTLQFTLDSSFGPETGEWSL